MKTHIDAEAWPQTRRLTTKNILRFMREAKKQFDAIKDHVTPGPMLVLPRNNAVRVSAPPRTLDGLVGEEVDRYRAHGEHWVLTSRRGKATVEDGRRAGNPVVYRRPKECRAWDLIECLARNRQQQSIPGEWFDELRRLLDELRIPNKALTETDPDR